MKRTEERRYEDREKKERHGGKLESLCMHAYIDTYMSTQICLYTTLCKSCMSYRINDK